MTRQGAVKLFKAISYVGIYGGLLMPLVFIPIVIFPFVFSKLIAFQILIGLTFPAYLALAWMEPKCRPPKSALYTAIIAYFGALLLSVIFSVDPSRSWWGNQERMNGLFTLLHFFAWLTMAIGVLKTWDQWKRLLGYEIVLSVVMAAVALLQKPFPNLLLFQANERVGGLLDNPIYMGAYQIFNLAFIALLFLKVKSRTAKWLLGVAALVDLAAFFAAQSRGALLGLAAMIGVFAFVFAIFTKNKRAKFGVLGLSAAGFVSYLVLFLLRSTPFVASHAVLNRITNFSVATETRFIAWDIAWKGFLERPLTGWGLDAFHILFNAKYNPKSLEFSYYETWFDRAHNTVMDVLSMTGIFGFVTFFAIFGALFFLVWRAYRKGWIDLPIMAILTALPIGYFLQNLFVFDHPAAFSMSYLLFAFVIVATRPGFLGPVAQTSASASAPSAAPPSRISSSHAAPWMAFAILMVFGTFVVWCFSVLPFRVSALSIKANGLLRAGQAEAGIALFRQAGTLPTPYTDEQSFLMARDIVEIVQAGQLTKMPGWQDFYAYAKEKNEQTNALHPLNTNNLFVYAQLLRTVAPSLPENEQMAEIVKSVEFYERSLKTSPSRQQVAYGLAQIYSELGRGQDAYDLLSRVASENGNIGETWWYLGNVAWLQLGRPDEGAEDLIKAVHAKTPFRLRSVRDAAQLAEAAWMKNDPETLKSIIPMLARDPVTGAPGLPGGSVDLYLNIARSFEGLGLTDERNQLLGALVEIEASLIPKLQALADGTVQTIDESFALVPTPSSTDVENAPMFIATSSPLSGPRR